MIELKDYLLPCDEELNLANYSEMFGNKIKHSMREHYQFIDEIFSLSDINKDGYISISELEKVIEKMNLMLGTKYTTRFILMMDLDKNGIIDNKEFKK